MRRSLVALLLTSIASGGGVLAGNGGHRVSVAEQRVADVRSLESIYWKHRLWPASNPGPKPSLAAALPDATIRTRVEDTWRKSEALRILWSRPVEPGQLRAELERMAAGTHDPDRLAELFAALGNDPARIAEALARPVLVDRLARDWYAMDGRFHAEVRRQAEEAAGLVRGPGDLRGAGGDYSEVDYVLREATAEDHESDAPRTVSLDPDSWLDLLAGLADRISAEPASREAAASRLIDALPVGRVGRLAEDAEGFSLQAVLEKAPGRIRLATAVWRKRSFDDWWKETRSGIAAVVPAVQGRFTLPALSSGCANDTWRPMRTEFPYGRQAHSAVWTGNEMIVWGGQSRAGVLKTGYRYQPATDSWTAIRSDATAPTARFAQVAVWTGAEMVIWGGNSQSGATLATGGRYDPITDTWRPTRADATTPSARNGFSLAWTGTEMFVWGGRDASGSLVNTGALYNPSTDTWRPTSLSAGVLEARTRTSAVWTGTEVILWGGEKAQPCCPTLSLALDTGARYNPSTGTWVPITGGGARSGNGAVWTGTEMIIWGGATYQVTSITPPRQTVTSLNTGFRYDPTSNTWTPTKVDASTPSGGGPAVWTGQLMIIWGGPVNAAGAGTGARYDPSSDTWTPTKADATTPSARGASSTIWTGTEMIVWGGGMPGTLAVNTGGRYNPVSDTWVATHAEPILPPTNPPPSSTSPQPPAVWTGSEMIFGSGQIGRYDPATDQWSPIAQPSPGMIQQVTIWTGIEAMACCDAQGVVSRYNPTTDSWTAPASTGGPVGRTDYSLVWDGREMILWGGITTPGTPTFLNTGKRYDPVANTWTATAVDTSTPAGRHYHSAIWTGSEMIVWGGLNDSMAPFLLNTGGRYDPVADAWTSTSSQAGNPPARYLHMAFWTGSEMIVWGAFTDLSGAPSSNAGSAYSPATNTWRQTSVTPATPSARTLHAATWTGREMIVWGGNGATGSALGNGGRYDPAADSWSPMVLDDTTPYPRNSAASAWTGSEMLIWGGGPVALGVGALNTGAGYCACTGPLMSWYRDVDGDGFGDATSAVPACSLPAGYVTNGTDCDDADAGSWATPGEARSLVFADGTDISWSPPAAPGGSVLTYDLIRSKSAADYVTDATCVASDTGVAGAADSETPALGGVFYYLVRAQDACPQGQGDLGSRSDGTPRTARSCP